MKEFWNERYRSEEFVYGTQANNYLKEKLKELPLGRILFPAEGEGRNSVFAAQLGWKTDAFDSSIEGKKKADLLAKKNGVQINYLLADIEKTNYTNHQFDAIALIYAHFPKEKRKNYHQKLTDFLKIGGYIVIEGFSKSHRAYQEKYPNVGGPKNIDLLYDLDEIKSDFEDFEFLEASQSEIELNEGSYHVGKASVVRIFAKKR